MSEVRVGRLTGVPVGRLVQNPLAWVAAGVLVALVVAYYPVFYYWQYHWFRSDGYYSHGILVPFLALYMVWMRREELRQTAISPSTGGLVPVALALAMRVLGHLTQSSTISSLSFLVLMYGMIASLLGWRFVRIVWFPVLFLGFMMPLPATIFDEISQPAQEWSTIIANVLLKTIGYETHRVGNVIYIPGGFDLDVGVPCSGFKMLVSMATFAFFFAYYIRVELWRQIALIVLALPLALVINGLRIALIGIVGTKFGEEAGYSFHDWSGYLVLVVAFAVLFQLGRWLGWQR
ncbi:MAG: exosortase/archaeosortase family protein [Chthonomonadetes bacterium]|nr:exosortase/archaeosortase family protein [Chthonomonadetes bacterium]